MSKVLFAREKHDERILPAGTEEELSASAFQLLKERFAEQWYYDPSSEAHPFVLGRKAKVDYLLSLDEQAIDQFPDYVAEYLRKAQKAALQQQRVDQAESSDEQKFYDRVAGLIAEGDPQKRYKLRGGRTISAAWWCLKQRVDYEYEYVELKEQG